MTATDPQLYESRGTGIRPLNGAAANRTKETWSGMAQGLGWFSIGLGIAEIAAPSAVARLIGVTDDRKSRKVLRSYGVREIGAGVGLLAQPGAARWAWSRVAGDLVDLSSLASALNSGENNKTRLTAAAAAVTGITALDVLCATKLGESNGAAARNSARATASVIVARSAEEAYNFWRDIENLPRFMTYLKSVRVAGDKRSHWIANAPMGTTVEWDAEIVADEPNRLIAWRSVSGAIFENAGSVSFETAPGNRGTLVRVEIDCAPNGGILNAVAGKVLGPDIQRRVLHDLRNFKQVLETGEVTQSDASVHEGIHPAQPPQAYPAGAPSASS